MEAPRLLCISNICRLCGEENKNSSRLFSTNRNGPDLSQLINKYLPLKVEEDGKFPVVICPGCNIQLEATKQFLDLIIEGQSKLRELLRQQQDTLRRQEKQKQQLENALKNISPNSTVETYTIETDESGEKFLIQIYSDGPLFPPEHELSLKAEGLQKPRRKRGRPPKPLITEEPLKANAEEEKIPEAEPEEELQETDAEGRRKRKIKVPSRFQEAVQGKELERIFKEEGVYDENSLSEHENANDPNSTKGDEIIGHLQNKEGQDLGELVINKGTNKLRIKSKDGQVNKRKYTCEICKRDFKHYGRYEAHKAFHKNIKYICSEDDCQFITDAKPSIEEHQKSSGHQLYKILESLHDFGQIEVQQTFLETETKTSDENETATQESPRIISPETKYTCKICLKNFSCKQNLDVHQKAVHENQRPFQCDKCHKTFSYFHSLKCHLLQHRDKNDKLYACDSCKKVFNHPSSLVYHREAEHNNGRRFVCNKCNREFKHKQLLQRHQLVHTNVRPYCCKMCTASFKTKANLFNHLSIHTGEKKYECTQCNQSFGHKTSLNLHIRWHSGQKPYQCDICLKTFSQKGNLAEHKRIHTGEKPYCCDHCGRKFTTSSQFKLHVKRHTGERPWSCEYCNKTFLHRDTWKCHTRRHRNERPYQCSQCLRGFTEQWALKKHERLHTGEKPYVCDICQKGFADCSNLAKHKRIHTNTKPEKSAIKSQNVKFLSSVDQSENQVLYLTYQDSNSNDSELPTFVNIINEPLPTDNQQEGVENDNTLLTNELQDNLVNYQEVLDENGSALSLTTTDGQQIKVLTTVENGNQCIRGLLPNGTIIPLGLSIDNSNKNDESVNQVAEKQDSESANLNIEKLDIPNTRETESQALDPSLTFLNNDSQKLDNEIQFLSSDGQNICLITAYNIDGSINPQYLAMA